MNGGTVGADDIPVAHTPPGGWHGFDFTTEITVVATYEDGVHVLRPVGFPVEVTRHLDGDQLIWNYLGTRVTLERVHPGT